jgi:hypothetical protein
VFLEPCVTVIFSAILPQIFSDKLHHGQLPQEAGNSGACAIRSFLDCAEKMRAVNLAVLRLLNGGRMAASDTTTLHASRRSEMSYLGVCRSCEDEKIRGMLVRAREISYASARRAISPAVLDDWASSFESVTGPYWRGLQLKGNPAVSFYRSRYDVFPCVYILHERVRHIFVGSP